MIEINQHSHGSAEAQRTTGDEKKNRIAVAGAVIAAAAAAFAVGKHLLCQQKFKNMQTFVLKADNGTEAHIRPLGCCIQRMSFCIGFACSSRFRRNYKYPAARAQVYLYLTQTER